jgi:hypothetical protein
MSNPCDYDLFRHLAIYTFIDYCFPEIYACNLKFTIMIFLYSYYYYRHLELRSI